jgi:Na+:H+ antiporter, NhaA family
LNLLHNGKKDKDITLKTYLQFLQRFQKLESASGVVLLFAAVSALVIANSSLGEGYQHLWHLSLKGISPLSCVNEGLMTLFFVLVGLELKREWVGGELSHRSQILLPAIAAAGGMLMPALIYIFFNYGHADALAGWAVPVATDIAFALGALSLVGKGVPSGLRAFLLALAIFDDIGAILIIALFYTQKLQAVYFLCAIVALQVLWLLNRYRVRRIAIYVLAGLGLWYCVLRAGIHPTIAGVLWALFVPVTATKVPNKSLEEALHPWVAYLIMPMFALANAGFSLKGLSSAALLDNKISMGIILGLFLGKPLGVLSFAGAVIYSGWSRMPKGANWGQLVGVSILCGIGFTMSLFLGTLAFSYQELYMSGVRLGVMLGSLLSGLVGCLSLFLAIRWKTK